jgi:hypothetical protein
MKKFTQNVFIIGKNSFKKFITICCLILLSGLAFGQIVIPSSTPVTQNFDGTVSGPTVNLPPNWKISAEGTSSPTWSAGSNFTSTNNSSNSGSPSSGGRYNWGNGTTTTDRAIGFMTSGTYNSPNSIMAFYNNTSGVQINDLTISFDYERYRINSAACAITFFTSTNGSTWTARTAGDSGTFSTGSSSYTFTSGTVVSRNFTLTGINIPVGGDFYLRWNFDTTGGNSQGIGLDNVSLTATLAIAAITSAQSGNWSSTSTWVGGVVPTSADNVVIASGHLVTMDTTTGGINTRNSGTTTTVNAGGTLATNVTYINNGTTTINGTFQLNGGGWVSDAAGTNSLVYGTNGTLIFNATYTASNGNYWPTTSGPINVTVNTSCPLTLNFARTVTGTFQSFASITNPSNLTINGTLQLNAGYNWSGSGSPIYGSASTLQYNSGGSPGRAAEWTATSGTIGTTQGLPNNVQVSNNTTLNFANGSSSTFLANGTVTIDSGSSLYQNFGGGNAGLNVRSHLLMNGNMTLGTSSGDLTVGGDLTIGSNNFNTMGRAVFFNASSGNQTISKTGGGTVNFDYLIIDKAAGNVIISSLPATDIEVNATAGNVLQLLNNGGLDLNGRTLTLNNNGGSIYVNGTRSINSSVAGGKLDFTNFKLIANNAATGSLTLASNVTVNLNTNGNLDFGKSGGVNITTLNGILSINSTSNCFVNTNPPIYGAGSLLRYNSGGTYGRGLEWSTLSGAGYPSDIQVTNSTTLNVPNTSGTFTTNLALSRDLTVDTNSSLFMDFGSGAASGSLTVGRNVVISGILSLGDAIGGDMKVAGNWSLTGTFNPNNRLVTFNGTTAQTLTGATNFDFLTLDNSNGLTLQPSSPVTINQTLALTSGRITIGANNLTIGSSGTITGASSSNYIVTASTGQLRRTVGASAILFPVGNTTYNPITFNNSGTSDIYGVRVANTQPAGLNPTKTITRQWITTENAPGGSNLAIVAQYNSGETGAGFATTIDNFIGFYNGATWEQVPASHTGSNPFSVSSNSNLSPVNMTTGTQYFAIGRDNAFKSDAVKYVVTTINPASPGAGYPFSVTVQAQDIYNEPTNVTSNSTFTLSTNGNAGAIGGTVTGTILSGTNSIVVSGVTLASAGTGATITATNTSGLSLTAGTSAAFNVLGAATQLEFVGVPSTGNVGIALTSFTVRALRLDNTVDTFFTGNITISKATGTGNLTGTLTVAAVAGVATFSTAQFDAAATYTLFANSGSLTQSTSGNIVVSLLPTVIAQFDFTPITLPTATQVTLKDTNVSVTDFNISSGTISVGVTSGTNFPNEPYIAGTGGYTSNTQTGAKNFNFTINANTGYKIEVTSFEFNSLATSAGPSAISFDIASGTSTFTANAPDTSLLSVNQTVNGVNNLTTIPILIQGWLNGSRTSSGTGNFRIDDVIVKGYVTCIKPTAFNVTGGGVICSGSSVSIGLSSSQVGINYQLKVNGSNIGSPVAGTGNAISFANQSTAGTYTVVATNTNGTCNETETMTGSVAISISSATATWDPALYSANSPVNWSEVPAANKNIVINGNYTSTGNLSGCSCTIQSGNVIISSGNTLFINNALNVTSGTITFENNASLVQTNNVTNTGNIIYKRTATAIDGFDYIFWSSPVDGQSVGSIHPDPGPIFSWNTLATNSNGASGNTSQGAWQPASGTMDAAKGYIIRGSSNFSATNMTINSSFTGIPRNGNIGATIVRGDFQGTTYNGANGVQITNLDDNHNLIGNPYPSAIRASEFINANLTLITGTVKLWQHGAAPSNSNTNPFYGTYTNNYANDYLTINLLGTLPYNGSEIIKAGQGFFVTMVDGPTGNGTVNFTNAMRVDGSGNPLDNAGFFRMATEATSNNEKSRIWLDLIHTQNNSSVANTMVGYLNLATNDYDSLYDAVTKLEAGDGLFSNLANKLYEIQGRATFTATDEVPLTIKINNAGNYKIGINAIDGLFLGNQDIFIKDNLLNVYHNIKLSPYAFDTVNGVFGDRFKIVYQNPLSNTTTNLETVNIFKNENVIFVNAKENIKSVKIFDISGRVLATNNNVNNTQFSYHTESFAQGVLIIQVTTEDGKVSTKKVL